MKKVIFIVHFLLFSIPLKAQIEVYIFITPDCPICRYYTPVLHSFAKEYKKLNCRFTYIIPSKYTTQAERQKMKRSLLKVLNYSNELVIADTGSFINTYNAKVTPEVFIKNFKGEVIYSGAIDDKYTDLKNHKQNTEQHFLKTAIERLLVDSTFTQQRVEPIGCIITR